MTLPDCDAAIERAKAKVQHVRELLPHPSQYDNQDERDELLCDAIESLLVVHEAVVAAVSKLEVK